MEFFRWAYVVIQIYNANLNCGSNYTSTIYRPKNSVTNHRPVVKGFYTHWNAEREENEDIIVDLSRTCSVF